MKNTDIGLFHFSLRLLCRSRIFPLLLFLSIASDLLAVEFTPSMELTAGLSHDSSLVVQEIDAVRQTGDESVNLEARVALEGRVGNRFNADISYGVSDINYREVDQFDLNTQLLMSSLGYSINGVNLGLTLYRADSALGGADYLTLSSAAPSVSFFAGSHVFLQGGFANMDKEFPQDGTRDAENRRIFVSAYYFLESVKNYVALTYANKEEDADAAEYDYSGSDVELSWIKTSELFQRGLRLKLGVKIEKRDYDPIVEEEVVIQRGDRRAEWLGEVTMDFTKHTFAGVFYRYSQNQSNQDELDYDQRSAGLQFGFKM